jgi:hypothetical protein
MSKVYYLATAGVQERFGGPITGPVHLFMIYPNLYRVSEQDRTVDECLKAATDKGFDVTRTAGYSSGYRESQLFEEIRKRLAEEMMKKYADITNPRHVCVDVVNRIVDRST